MRTWAISGVDLHLDLGGTRVRAALEDALRDAVRTGRLAPGVRLPSSRALATDLGVSRNTVAEAYGQLVAEGWLTARQGSGTRGAARPPATGGAPAPAERPRPLRYDLRPGFPDTSSFPRSAWLAALRRTLPAAPVDAFGYGDPRGLPELRAALAEYLARARGVHADADRVLVCSGFTQGLRLLCDVLRGRGAGTLAVEAYGHASHRELVRDAGLGVAPLPVDADGARVDPMPDAAAAVLTPAHQYPLGVALAAHRRTQAVGWAHETGGFVVEDDYDGEFRYDRRPLGAMQALAPDHVVYAGTARKSLAPALRLGWLVLPASLVDDVATARRLADAQPGVLDQLALAELLRSGGYDRHVRARRLEYRRRLQRLLAALRREAPAVEVSGIAAGMHAVLELPGGAGEADVVARAARNDVSVEGLAAYRAPHAPGPAAGPAIVVGYATPPDHAYTTAMARLCAVLAR
ncbi:MAG TPA: PLP-dependent aminotransferase family protein [Streptosporangiales bacterium]